MTLLRLFLLVACVFALAQGHSSGAPSSACNSMVPDHEAAQNIAGANPKFGLVAPKSVAQGSSVTISLGGSLIKGFMVRVLNGQGRSANGRFGAGPNNQAITCDTSGDTATHSNPSPKSQVDLTWTAPSAPGVYRVMASIVEQYDTFYTGYYTDVTVV